MILQIDTDASYLVIPGEKVVFQVISNLGYDCPTGAEYKPKCPTDQSLGWLRKSQAIASNVL